VSNDFSTRPFVAGALTGIRSFKVADGGQLTGVMHPHDFNPGVNVADCCIRHSGAFAMTVCGQRHKPPANHRPGTLTCTCGFYAYFDRGHNQFNYPGNVLALIEGFGLMSVGARGFRAEKARLVAFIDESNAVQPLKVEIARSVISKAARWLRIGHPDWDATTVPFEVRRAYPGVPVYRSVDEALAAHPLVAPERPKENAA